MYLYFPDTPRITVLTLEEWLQIADEFNEICKMPNSIGGQTGKTASSNAHQTPNLCILITKLFTQ
jgi:hypothetical protein